MISLSKKYVTRDGRKAKVICVDKKGEWPVVAIVEHGHEEIAYTYDAEGNYCGTAKTWDGAKYIGLEHGLDLIQAPQITTKYAYVFESAMSDTLYDNLDDLKEMALYSDFKGVLKIDFVDGNLSNVSVERNLL